MQRPACFILAVLTICVSFTARADEAVLIEAERFDQRGGWVDDSQFIDQMGSTFLLAHGLGRPVEDATTAVSLPRKGPYHIWVRTRDWVAPWDAPGTPGIFQLLIDGQALDVTFGTESADWAWQYGGATKLDKDFTLALHDLTGFEGRCDAILFSPVDATNPDAKPVAPPNDRESLDTLRRKLLNLPENPVDEGEYDLVVVGGGISGTCAAVSAARLGLSVALVQDRPVLGGNNSSEVRVWLHGAKNVGPYPRVGDIVNELEQSRRSHYGPTNTADLYEDDKKLALVRSEENIRLFLEHRAIDATVSDDSSDENRHLTEILTFHTPTGSRHRIRGRLFADCTGDGCLGASAGADFELTGTGHMGRCNLWHVTETDAPIEFPRCPWALDLAEKPFPGRNPVNTLRLGGWYWESGFDHDPFDKSEYIRDWNFRAAYGAWDALKNVDCVLPNHDFTWMAHISGKRESRRLLGDVILTKEDLLESRRFEDGCVPTGWKIDLHLPDPKYVRGFEGDAFISRALFTGFPQPYWVPYRCLYSRNVDNLFMAGRDTSVTHDALGSIRVMRTGGCMGEIVGMAASICRTEETTPRGVYSDHLETLKALMLEDRRPKVELKPISEWKEEGIGENVARKAKVEVSGVKAGDRQSGADLLIDGSADTQNNTARWISDATLPAWAEFHWDEPQTITAARIISGFNQSNGIIAPIESFTIQYRDGEQWQDIEPTRTASNQSADWHCRFDPITTKEIRLSVTKTHVDHARVWEVQLYEPSSSEN